MMAPFLSPTALQLAEKLRAGDRKLAERVQADGHFLCIHHVFHLNATALQLADELGIVVP